jgi:4,5-dihydroxyphthalate decarboxylase
MTAEKIKLSTLLGSYPNAMALKDGAVKSDLVAFDFADVKVSNTAFKPLVREAKFDVAELAIVTFLQAKVWQTLCAHSGHRIGTRPASHNRLQPGARTVKGI